MCNIDFYISTFIMSRLYLLGDLILINYCREHKFFLLFCVVFFGTTFFNKRSIQISVTLRYSITITIKNSNFDRNMLIFIDCACHSTLIINQVWNLNLKNAGNT